VRESSARLCEASAVVRQLMYLVTPITLHSHCVTCACALLIYLHYVKTRARCGCAQTRVLLMVSTVDNDPPLTVLDEELSP
jgi:hypothetical protein